MEKNPISNQFKTLKDAKNRQKPSEFERFSLFSLFPTSSTGSTMTVNYAPATEKVFTLPKMLKLIFVVRLLGLTMP